MAQGIRDYHLIMVAEHPILEPCVRNCCGCNHAAVSLTQQQYKQLVRITVFCSAIVIDVIVHCHTAGALLSQTAENNCPYHRVVGF